MSTPPHILITRPIGQHQPFIDQLQVMGLAVSHLPCLAIEAVQETVLQADPAEHHDSALFTSVNAVRQAHQQRPLPWPGLAVYAIGSATGQALQHVGQTLATLPDAPYDSESFLAQIGACQPGRLLLVKGCGGRGVLAPGLRSLGWQVDSANVYRRRLPDIPLATVTRIFEQHPPQLISITSNECLQNLMTLCADHLPLIHQLPLVVNSVRGATLARDLGFVQPPLVATPPGDQGQLECIRRWLRS